VGLILRFALGTLFLLAGSAKVVRLERFADAVQGYRMVPEAWVGSVAAGLAVTEAILGGLLLGGVYVPIAATFTTFLLLVFSLAVALNLRRGRRIACGCLGALGGRVVSGVVLLRNAVLVVAALALALISSSVGFARLHGTEEPVSTATTIAMLIAGTVCVFMVAVLEEGVRVLKLQLSSRRGFSP
jgi:hypothetical protein